MNADNGPALFVDSVNQLMESSLILVDKQIANVLKSVVQIPALKKSLSDTLKRSTYVTEFSRARVTLTRPDGSVEARLKLPADKNRLFAFVVCLLAEIDGGKRNFLDFLKEYYYDADSNVSYAQFVTEVLKPFKKAGESILKSVDPDGFDDEATARAEKYFYVEKSYVSAERLNRTLSALQDCRTKLEAMPDNAEAIFMCDALCNALHLKNAKILQMCWIGFKNTVGEKESFRAEWNELAANMQNILS